MSAAELLEIAEVAVEDDEHDAERLTSRRIWAAMMLALDVDVCRSILAGRPVLAKQLDVVVLRRALRGTRLPDPHSYFRVRPGHLDAIAEAGPITSTQAR
jgi:hypothetical protein